MHPELPVLSNSRQAIARSWRRIRQGVSTMKTTRFWTGCVALAASTVLSDAASAQQLAQPLPEAAPHGETVATRVRPELEPLGIRAGSFLILPKLGVDGTYNDNVFATNHD